MKKTSNTRRTRRSRRRRRLKRLPICLLIATNMLVVLSVIGLYRSFTRPVDVSELTIVHVDRPEPINPMVREETREYVNPTTAVAASATYGEFAVAPLETETVAVDEVQEAEAELIQSEVELEAEAFEHDVHMAVASYTSNDVELLANIMWLEEGVYVDNAEGEYVHKLAGSVVLHRVKSPRFANSIYGVLHQPGQYAKRTINLIGKQHIPSKVYTWAEELLRDGPIGPSNLVFQAQFKQGSSVYYHYGNQYFCLQ